jgi:hypothetical protein
MRWAALLAGVLLCAGCTAPDPTVGTVTPEVTPTVTADVTRDVTRDVVLPERSQSAGSTRPASTPSPTYGPPFDCAQYGDRGPDREACDDAKESAADDGGEVGADEWCNPDDPGYPCDVATMPPLPTAPPSEAQASEVAPPV